MRKLLSLLLVLALCCSLVGCGGGSTSTSSAPSSAPSAPTTQGSTPSLAFTLPTGSMGGSSQKPAPKRSESSMLSSQTAKGTYLELNKGDMVEHTAFGKGMVLSVIKMGGDALLEIAFDNIGTKKVMAKTASAHMKKL